MVTKRITPYVYVYDVRLRLTLFVLCGLSMVASLAVAFFDIDNLTLIRVTRVYRSSEHYI